MASKAIAPTAPPSGMHPPFSEPSAAAEPRAAPSATQEAPRPFIELSSEELLLPLLKLLSSSETPVAIREVTEKLLRRHVRITHPDALPLAPLDASLVGRVAAQEAETTALSARVTEARATTLQRLEETLSRKLDEVVVAPEPPEPVKPAELQYKDLANTTKRHTTGLADRFENAKKQAELTRKQTCSMRDVLKLLSENVPPDRRVAEAVAEDWTVNFSDHGLGSANTSRKRMACEMTPDKSPEPATRSVEGEQIYCAISPHVTPRSKLRKRLARSADRGSMRQPSFTGLDLPR